MESCQKYTADDQKPNPEDYLNRSKKDSDFDKLTRKFQDNENLSQIEKDRLLQEIRNWIKCDINLSLLEAQKNPNQKNYHKSRQILFIAQQYGMDIAQWEERVDKLFPVNFLKNEERTLLNDYIEKIENYINIKSRTQEDYIDAFIAYKHAIQSIARLSDLGPNQDALLQFNKIKGPFLSRYIDNSLDIVQAFLEGKIPLLWDGFSKNDIKEWRMSFESVLADLETFGNLNSKYQEILRKYRNILPELLVKEGNIDIGNLDRKIK